MIFELLEEAQRLRASDLHLAAGAVPRVRVHGEISFLKANSLSAMELEGLAAELLSSEDLAVLNKMGQVDCAVNAGQERFRLNIFRQRQGLSIAIRIIKSNPPDCKELGLPPSIISLAELKQGLVLIGGPTGSGKSTTLAALINKLNKEKQLHIITLEDPVEYIYPEGSCLINQREVGRDTQSFASGLRAALREDPDVILVGELRDADTMATALTAAETGHLVLATIHTTDAVSSINRILDVLSEHQQQVQTQLADCLQGVVCQRLLPRRDENGRVGAFEVLVVTDALRSLIREGRTCQISSYLQTGARHGMQTMASSVNELKRQGII